MLPSVFAPGTPFSSIFHASPVAMTVNALPDGRYVDVNDSFAQLVGYARGELVGHRAIDLGIITPARREPVVRDLLRAGELINAPQQLIHRSGEPRQVIVSAQLVEHDEQLFTVAIIQDLTAYHQTQEALRLFETRFRLFFETIPLPVWVFDLETLRILDANPAACRAYGYTLDELRALSIADIRPLEQLERFQAHLPHLRRSASDFGIWRHQKKDGTPLDVAITGYTIEVDGRRLRVSVLRDVTQQLADERALAAGQRRLELITNLSTDGIWDWDMAASTISVNETFRQLYGAPESSADVPAWWIQHIHPDDRAGVMRSLGQAITARGSYWTTEYRMMRSGGAYATVIVRGHVLRDGDGRATRIIGALVDISRQMEVTEAATIATLEERQRLARDLHDSVTQSLYSITLLAEVARRYARADDAPNTLEQIYRLGELSQQCLREMRLLVWELRPALVEEIGLVSALRQRLQAVEQRSGVRIDLTADDDARIPRPIQYELFRVAEEALNNALKHAHASHLSVTLRASDEAVELEVADNGRGFDAVAARASGGQGLANMRERVARLAGRFDINTAPGRATTIHVEVPLPRGGRRPGASPLPLLRLG